MIDLTFQSEDALNNRIYASGKTKDKYAPNYDAFLWDWDVGGVTPTPILEVLRSFDASSDSFYDSKKFDAALQEAKVAETEDGTVAAVRKSARIELGDLPYLPLVHPKAIDVVRRDTWHGWIRSPEPDGEPIYQITQQILALQPGPRTRRERARSRGDDRRDDELQLADHAALRADRLRADLARDHRVDVHRERAPKDRAARVD